MRLFARKERTHHSQEASKGRNACPLGHSQQNAHMGKAQLLDMKDSETRFPEFYQEARRLSGASPRSISTPWVLLCSCHRRSRRPQKVQFMIFQLRTPATVWVRLASLASSLFAQSSHRLFSSVLLFRIKVQLQKFPRCCDQTRHGHE